MYHRTLLIIDASFISKEDCKKMKNLSTLDLVLIINFENLNQFAQDDLKKMLLKEEIFCQIIFLMSKLVKHMEFEVLVRRIYDAELFKIPETNNLYFIDENQKFNLQNKKVYIINDFKRYKSFCKCCSEAIDIVIYLDNKLDRRMIHSIMKNSLSPKIYIDGDLCNQKSKKLFKRYPVYSINKEIIML